MKIMEVLIACILFIAVASALSGLIFQIQSFLDMTTKRMQALAIAHEILQESSDISLSFTDGIYDVQLNIKDVDNYTQKKEIKVTYDHRGRSQEAVLSTFITHTLESDGQSSCRPRQDEKLWNRVVVSTTDLNKFGIDIHPTDIDMVGPFVFISSNTAKASSSDLFIFNASDPLNLILLAELDTGPGIEAIKVAGKYVYAANTSSNSHLQIVDKSNLQQPFLVSSYKLSDASTSSPTISNTLFYKAGKIFLGTQKSQIEELHYLDVSTPSFPIELDAHEIGHGINDIFAYKEKLYVASPHTDEMKAFTITSSGKILPFASYNDPGSTGNGKSLSLFLDTLYLGKTFTFAKEELLALSASSTPQRYFGMPLGTSVQDLLRYGNLLFALLHQSSDGLAVYTVGTSSARRLNEPVKLPAIPLHMDCDKNLFAIIYEESLFLTFITHS
jgi:hypothetical protein